MFEVLAELLRMSYSTENVQSDVNELARSIGYPFHFIIVRILPQVERIENLPPMFTLGIGPVELDRIRLPPIGFIFVREDFYKWAFGDHLRVYFAHEIGHISKWHPLGNPFKLGKLFLSAILAPKDYEIVESLWNIIKMFEYIFIQRRPIEEEITRKQELEADEFTLEIIGDKRLVISALERLNEIVPDGLSHFTDVGMKIPILSIKERIDAIQELEVGEGEWENKDLCQSRRH